MSTAKDTLATDNGQTPDHDLGMALYLDEWMTLKKVRNADLARALECDRSLVGHWRNKKRALRDINWINGICTFLGITPQQLAKMPPKSEGKLGISSGLRSEDEPTADVVVRPEGIEMIEKRVKLHESLEELPDELLETAHSLINRLKNMGGGRPPHPSRRGSTKA